MKVDSQFAIMEGIVLPDYADVAAVRSWLKQMMSGGMLKPKGDDDVAVEALQIGGPAGAPDLGIRLYRPRSASPAAALIHLHGGSLIMGDLDMEDAVCRRYCREAGCLVVGVDYRLAPENRYPAQVEDAYAALVWTAANMGELGLRGGRIAIGGHSCGGLLAAAVSIMARDRGGPSLALQLMIYPALDDRMDTPSMHQGFPFDVPSRAIIGHMWRHYLGGPGVAASPYAAPARATDLSGLPPAYLEAGAIDRVRDETIAYASRLLQAGIPAELHILAGAVHGFDVVTGAEITERAYATRAAALRRAFLA